MNELRGSGCSLPLSAAQLEVWFAQQLDPDNPIWNIAEYYVIEGDLDVALLERAVRVAVGEAECLRVRFGIVGDEVRQTVVPCEDWEFSVVDFTGEVDPDGAALGWMRADAGTVVALDAPVLFRFALLRVGPDRAVLYQRAHHLLWDGFSEALFVARVAGIYTAVQEGRSYGDGVFPPLAGLIEEELAYRESARFEKDRGFWAGRFAGPVELTSMSSRPITAVRTFVRRGVTLGVGVAERMRAVAWGHRVAWPTYLIAATACYVQRVTGVGDVVLSLPVTARTSAVTKATPGMRANLVPLVLAVRPGMGRGDVLAHASREVGLVVRHQRFRTREIRQMMGLSPEDRRPVGPEVNVANIFGRMSFGTATVKVFDLTTAPSDDLTILMHDSEDGGLRVEMNANTDLYDVADVEAHLARFTAFLDTFTTAPADQLLSTIDVLGQEERRRLLVEWNSSAVEGGFAGVVERVRERAVAAPDGVAVLDDAGSVSYRELVARANAVAKKLPAGVLVGLLGDPGVRYVSAVLGVLGAGGAYVPFDPAAPVARIADLIADSGIEVLIVAPEYLDLAREVATGVRVLVFDDAVDGDLGPVRGVEDDLAYVMFTSGSTGRPKGAMVHRRGMVNHLLAKVEDLGLDSSDVVVQNAPLTFDISVWQMLAALIVGARVRVVSRESAMDPQRLFGIAGVTVLEVVPSLLRAALDTKVTVAEPGLRWLLVTGEALPAELCRRWLQSYPAVPVMNAYGPTECSDDVTHAVIRNPGEVAGLRTPIGRPVRNTQLYVLGDDLQPVPVGVPGELYVGGVGVGRGYLNDPARTAAVFVASPFGGGRLYRTGDRVVYRPDGQLEFLERRDFQVKIRGHRIELGEIETAIRSADGVRNTVVTADRQRLVAYVVGQVEPGALQAHVAALLPDYMVPAVVMILDALPLTSNGKLDRKALPEPDFTATAEGRGPRDPREEVLCALFAEVLDVDSVGIDDSFFDLGGHSLLAVRLISRVRGALGVELSVRDVFDAPTVAGLAGRMGDEGRSRPVLVAGPRPGELPLSFGQRRLWFLNVLEGASATYTIPVALRLTGELDRDALAAALADVVERHEVLRTVYPEVDGRPVQEIKGQGPELVISEVIEAELPGAIQAACSAGFDLIGELPIRSQLFILGPTESVLLLVIHHIAGDGWSAMPLARDFAAAYEARCSGMVPGWKPLPVQYVDYALWQRELLGSEDDERSLISEQLGFWTRALEGLPEEIALPADRPRPAIASYRGDAFEFVLAPELTAGLGVLARQNNASLFMVLQAGLSVLLSKLGAGTDVPLGSPVAGRTDDALDDLVGFFVNTLVLRTDLSGDPTVRELLGRVRDADLAAFAHQDVPFERLVDVLNPARSRSRHPLFQVMMALQNNAAARIELAGLEVSTEPLISPAIDDDLFVEFTEHGDGSVGVLVTYATDLFDRATVQRMSEQLVRVLDGMASGVDAALSAIDVLGQEERRRLLVEWNPPAVEGGFAGVVERVRERAVAAPDHVAVTDDSGSVSYRELVGRANAVAKRLPAGALVGLLGDPGVRYVSAVLGVLGAGGAYVPFDPGVPVARTAGLVADSGIGVLIAAPEYLDLAREAVGAGGVRVLVFDDATDGDLAPVRGVGDDLAYVMFTSGSTGRPKGAMVHRRGMVNHLLAKVEDLGLDSSDVVVQNAPLTFDISVWQMLAALIVGAQVRVVSRETAMNPQQLFGISGVTVLEVVPSLLRAALDVWDAGVPVPELGLRWLESAGEALPAELCRRWLQRYPAVPVMNVYAPTECSDGVTGAVIRSLDEVAGLRTPIGRPVRNTQVYVLGDDLQPVPVGVPGELYVGGVGVGRGYLNDSARTAAVFVASPFGGGRLYRTGDRVVYRPDGQLEFLERRDFQVKIRGHRIELGEIETAIRSADGVRNTVVTTGEQHLVAYVVPAAGPLDTAVLREYLTGLLPEYMLPAVYVTLDELPLSSNGKLDRKALPAPDFTTPASGRGPRNPWEEVMCSVFAEVLGVDSVGIDDSFFDLGGHSLLAVRLISRVRGALGVELSVRDVFDAPTVAGLVGRMGDEGRSRPVLVAGPRPGELPLSFGQRRLWFLNVLEGASATYNVPMLLRLRGSLDRDALAAALADVVERHEVLRTVYPEVDGRPVQVIRSDRPELVVRSVTEAELPAAIPAACSGGFDLTAELPVRAELYVLGQSEYVLLVVLHHIASDGWSMMPLARDFATAYEARCSGMVPGWKPLPVQYVDYALWQRELLGSEDDEQSLISEQLGFWTKTLDGLPEEIALPTDRPRPAIASYRGDAFEFVLTSELTAGLEVLARQNNASLFMVLRAGLSVLLSKLGAGTDIPLGSPFAGRTDDALDDLVGFFANTLVLRTDLSGDPTVRELLGRVRDADLAAFAHQDVPFERLVEVINPARSQSRQPLFQVMMVLQNNAAARVELPGLDAGVEPLTAPAADFDLEFDFDEHDDGSIGVLVTYATDLFDRATVQEISARLERVLNGMASGVDAPLSAIDVLGQEERRRLLVEWNPPAVEGGFAGVVERVRERAVAAPDGVAVLDDAGSVSYRELVARANAVAKKLPGGALVGLLGDPGVRYVSAVLGVLGAGGAYVPFDPGAPVARIADLIADSGIEVLIVAPEYLDLAREVATGVRVLVFDDATDGDLGPVRGVEDDLAYVMFTSGSTGRPKGAMVHRRGMVNHLLAKVEDLGLDSSDVVVQNAPVTFDISVWQMLAALIVGAQVRVVSRETAMDPQRLFGIAGVTVLEVVPSLLRAALDTKVTVAEPGLRWLLVTGEALPAELCRRWLQSYPAVPVMNAYGPTECSDDVTHAVIRNPGEVAGLRTPIGRPVRNTQLYVLGDDLQPVPVGVPGELYVGGVGVGRGYLNDPARTAAVFVASPFGGGRLYRTGDRVVYRPDGQLEFLERRDFQVKIRGHRIELGEIETAIRSADGVRNTVVTTGEQHLVAYVVPAAGALDTAVLREYLTGLLPEYMLPAVYVTLDELPLSSNGKLDRKALPAPDFTTPASGRAPRNPREEAMCSVFAEVLGVDTVSIDDSFFDLGGHSLLAVRLISRIRGALGVELSVRDVFDAPTVAGLVGRMGDEGRSRPVLVAGPRPGELPLSFGQQRLWFLNLLDGASATYNLRMTLRLTGELNQDALAAALADVVERHEVLRTVYPEVDGRPVQVIRSDRPELVVRSVTEAELPAACSGGFDLTAELPMRAELYVLGQSEYVLLVVLHHIASDGWSAMPLARDFAAAYEARSSGMAPQWKPLPVQYVDYALWQRELLGSEDDEQSLISEQLGFWTRTLEGLPEEIALPADRPRPAIASYQGDAFEFVLTPELTSGLEVLARQNNASLFMVLRAGLSVLLSKLGAGTDIPLGSPVAGRTDDALDDLVGFFVNTLVLRADLSGDPTVRELLGRVRDADLAAFAHQDVPFERLVDVLNPARTRSRHPLFQVMMVLQNNAAAQVKMTGLDATVDPLRPSVTDFDLNFDFTEHGDGGVGVLVTYATDLFDRATVQRMSEQLVRVLDGMASGVDAPLSAIDVLGQEERRRLLVEWNPPAVEGGFAGVVERVRERAVAAPDGVAVTDDAGSVTYRELVARANAVAKKLPAGALVGLLGDPGVRYVSAVLGVLGAGGAYVPFDPSAPVARTVGLVADSGVEVLIVAPEYLDLAREAVGAGGVRVLVFDDAVDGDLAPALGGEDDLAYVMFTSGSTGRPKGVMVHRRGMVNHLLAKVEDLGLDSSDVVVQNAPLTFDISVWQMLAALIVGAQVRVVSRETAMDPQRLFGIAGVTVLEVVPSLLRAALDVWDAGVPVPELGLRWLESAGEALPAELCRRWLQRFPAVPVMNVYAPTECSDGVTGAVIRSLDEVAGLRTPIGRPVRNTRVYVLGDDLQPVPVGVPGELYVGGVGVGRGYLNDSARTAAVFVASPFGGGRLYRTGDRVVYRPDGQLEFLERRDFQVKIRGHRIELGEIETAIRSADGVRNAVVTAGEQHLVAYVVGQVEPDALQAHVATLLPDYMVPAVFMILDALPLTSNGKLDRKALPAPDFTTPASGRAPRNPREEALCSVFAEVLDVDSVGIDDSFFDLGGHSLLAVRLISRIRGALGVELSVRDVFDAPTVAGLVGRMGDEGRSRPVLVAGPRPGELPLSFGQRRLWFLNLLEGASATYNIPMLLRLRGSLDRDALAAALADVVERHEVLRTVYPEVDGRPVQVIRSDSPKLVVRSVTEAELPAAIPAACSGGFDLTAELPVRAELYVLGQSEYVLLVVLHHIAGDGWSMMPLARDFAAAYEARSSGMVPQWKPLPVQYVDYALWQRELLGSEDDEQSLISEQLGFWTKTLDGLPEEIALPADRPRPAIASYRSETVTFELDALLYRGLAELGRETGASLFMVLQAGLSVLLSKLGAGTDIPLGSPVAGRTDDALDDLVGFFVNTLVLRTDLSGDPTVRELLGRVRDADLAAFAHQDVPFERLVEMINPARSQSRQPLFQVMMVLQNNAAARVELPGLDAGVEPLNAPAADFDLEFDFDEHDDGSIGVLVTYATDLFDCATVQRMSEQLVRVLNGMASGVDAPLSAIDVLGQEERRRLLVEWNSSAVEGGFAGVVERVRERAVAAPDGVAVLDDAGSVSYRELVARANAVAKKLPGGALVGLLGDPGVRYVSAVLGALGAGGAYVPFDPAAPVARIADLIADSGIEVLIAAPEYLDLAREAVGAGGVRVLVFDDATDGDLGPVRGAEDDLAYVIYTSGSTGRPEGAMVHRRGMVNHLLAKVEDLGLDSSDVVVQNAPLTFDISVWQMLAALIVGARVRVVSRETAMDPQRLFGIPGVTVLEVVPSLLRAALDTKVTVAEPGLRWLLVTGEALPAELCRRWLQSYPAVPVMNAYGPTECSDDVTHAVIRNPGEVAGLRTPIGRPVRNTQLYVLGDDLQPVPVGVPGELYVGGVGVGRGYLNDSARTAAVFVASPFGQGRLYRTGDRVVYRPDGQLEFLERRKSDRETLPEPAPDSMSAPVPRGPRNLREEALCALFAEVLGVDTVGIDDSFFDLGGHSLQAVKLISRIRNTVDAELSIRDLFDTPTVAGLAGRADVSGSVNSFEVLLPLRVTGHHTPIFCVHPVGCVAWPYIALTAQLGPDFPVYGLQARGMLEPDRVPESVEQMAADYLEQVRTVQPEGPYHLLGWSFGGVVAHEMARQLQQAGQTVALLASLDSHPVAEAGEVELTSDTELLRAILALFGHAAPQRPSAAEVLEILRHEHNLAVLATEEQLMNVVAAWRANVELNLAHRPGRVGGRMLHFVAGRENTPGDWTPFAETVDNHRIDCGHDEMLQPEPLAEISRVLAKEIIPKE
ncbi:amino acid adenylation domain-containing protein [Streptosporangium sp. NBC_01810]|uniref:non-ribosomal peptide synthetase n=1 Tax=Streptosporangium sp. NBC_01810 TaxID=2975951 RepID=UPI002DDC17EB|nr:non-ribosomal peptide synthetase [Streptosporangium sp. NBC_01810]WSA28007.1 amino acid adenylation domain-containing protein [Streptosporangium sp. NBC_01810]